MSDNAIDGRVMIMAAPNGARRTHADHHALPMTPEASAAEAQSLVEAGVSILHLHVRDASGGHTLDPARYREAISAIESAVGDDLVIQITTEAVGQYQPQEQMACVRELQPAAVSIALRELCPDEDSVPTFQAFYAEMLDSGIWPQIILYSPEDVRRFTALREWGVFGDDAPFLMLVVGAYQPPRNGSVDELDQLLAHVPDDATWAVCCFGADEQAVALAAVERGGHVRLGFENNLTLPDGSEAPDNPALIRSFRSAMPPDSCLPATAAQIRAAFF